MTLSDEQFLAGSKAGTRATISAELRLPRADALPRTDADRQPAMVLMHGSGGVQATEDRWARELNDLGIATLTVDSFTGRGILYTAADQSQLGVLAGIVDAYRTIRRISTQS